MQSLDNYYEQTVKIKEESKFNFKNANIIDVDNFIKTDDYPRFSLINEKICEKDLEESVIESEGKVPAKIKDINENLESRNLQIKLIENKNSNYESNISTNFQSNINIKV